MPDERQRVRFARLRRAAVQFDSHPAALGATRWLRSRLPGDSRFGDALSTAGQEGPQLIGRRVSALQPDRASAAHELGLGALQLWQGLSEVSGRGRGSGDVTLLFADLVDFSSWALHAGDEACVELLRAVGVATETAIGDAGGVVVKRLGDGVMVAFDSVDAAAGAVFDLRRRLEAVEVDGYRPRMRFGLHRGRARRLGGDYFGVDVNTAARVMAAAGPDQLLVSEPTADELDDGGFRLGKPKRLKARGAPADLRVLSVEPAT